MIFDRDVAKEREVGVLKNSLETIQIEKITLRGVVMTLSGSYPYTTSAVYITYLAYALSDKRYNTKKIKK
jgi:hypothetical protein